MTDRDLKSNLDVVSSIRPAAHTSTANGAGVDLKGYRGAVLVFHVGTITDGTHTPKMQESDDNSAWNDVAAADQQGSLAALASDTDQRVGYIGNKQYVRAVSTVAGATTGGLYSAHVIRGLAHTVPLA